MDPGGPGPALARFVARLGCRDKQKSDTSRFVCLHTSAAQATYTPGSSRQRRVGPQSAHVHVHVRQPPRGGPRGLGPGGTPPDHRVDGFLRSAFFMHNKRADRPARMGSARLLMEKENNFGRVSTGTIYKQARSARLCCHHARDDERV